jgi:hypothetical protein
MLSKNRTSNFMKRFLLLMAMCTAGLVQTARGADVSINLFYDNLSGGNWYEVADYGYVWQPDVAGDTNWRPYTDGYWAYTDQGWTWVSYEDFGWATYHYGRWARLTDYGWVWVPGTDWAPAWVSWRTGGDYVGWAPLPPAGGGEVVYEGRPITGHVDVEFGIGPAYYNFIDLRYIGEPVLRDRIFPYERNVTVINNTVNVTNITYNNAVVYSYGPDYATVSRYSVRPIQRLKLERQTIDPSQAIKTGNVTKVQGNTLVVAAPQKLQKAAGTQVAPKQVKARIEQPKVEKGWANTDPNEKTKLEQKFKAENAKNVPKPNIQPSNVNAAAGANANDAAGAKAGASPVERAGKGKRKGEKAEAGASQAPVGPVEQGKPGKNKNRREGDQAAGPTAPQGANENQPANAGAEDKKHKKANKNERNVPPAAAAPTTANERKELKTENPNAAQDRQNQMPARRDEQQPAQPSEAQQRRHERMQNAPGANEPPAASGPGPRQHREQAQDNQPPQREGGAQPKAKEGKGKGKKNEGEQTPPPQ